MICPSQTRIYNKNVNHLTKNLVLAWRTPKLNLQTPALCLMDSIEWHHCSLTKQWC